MFSNRRKRIETNKILHFNNQLNAVLSPHQGVIPELTEIDLWLLTGDDIYNANSGNVGIHNKAPLTALDVSGTINTNTSVTLNYVPIAPPIGSIIAYTMSTSPDGWLICDGSTVSRTEYVGLFGVIGTTFGAGDGDTTFSLPNYQGAFLRGTGSQGVYSGPNVNTSQTHATQTHNHGATTTIIDPGHTHTQTNANDDYNGSNTGGQSPTGFAKDAYADAANNKITANINSSITNVTASTTISNSTNYVDVNETRPYNYGVYWIIKC